MDIQVGASYLLISGFILVLAASIVGPNEVYTAPDNAARLKIIAKNKGPWAATNLLWGAGSLLTAAGFIALTISIIDSHNSLLLYGGAAAFTIGAVAWAIFLYQRIQDPAGNLYTTPPALLSVVFGWATIAALLLYGVAFLLGSYPNWLGYTLVIPMVVLAGGMVFSFDVFYAKYPPQFFYLLSLIVGIVSLYR